MGGGTEKPKSEDLLIILPFPEPTKETERIRQKHPHIKVTYIQQNLKPEEVFAKPLSSIPGSVYKDTTILVTLAALPPNPKQDAPNLDLVHFFSAGTNAFIHHPIYTSTDITLTTSSGVHGPQISEWIIMTLLVQSHKYNGMYEQQKKHNWSRGHTNLNAVRDMVGQRIGILGYGSIGRQAARVCQAMGMEVLAYTATPKKTAESKKDKGFIVPGTGDIDGTIPKEWYSGLDKESLHHFLSRDLDVLLVSVPLTPQTKHLLGAEEFSVLARRNAFVSNISRGQIIDQPALIEALQYGKLRGCALDVTDPEPLEPESPLWGMENVTITPHISGLSAAYADRSFQILEKNLDLRERGQKLINVVDRKTGY